MSIIRCCTAVFVFLTDQDQSLRVLSFEARAGRAICPYDPSSNYTIVYVGTVFLSSYTPSACLPVRFYSAKKVMFSLVCLFVC